MLSPDNRSRWGVPEPSQLCWEIFVNDALIFNEASGETHHLNELACFLLQQLSLGKHSIDSLIVKICDIYEIEDLSELKSHLPLLLEELEELGLVESFP